MEAGDFSISFYGEWGRLLFIYVELPWMVVDSLSKYFSGLGRGEENIAFNCKYLSC
jgi:hypothetical protein